MKIHILTVFSFIMLVSCTHQEKNFFNGAVKSIQFSNNYNLYGQMVHGMDTIGVGSMDIFGNHLIYTMRHNNSFMQVYSYPDSLKYFGSFFHKGQGPKDFLSFSIIKAQYPLLWINDYQRKLVSKVDISNGFTDDLYEVKSLYSYKKVPIPLMVFYLNDTCLIIKYFDNKKGICYANYNPSTGVMSKELIMYNYEVTLPLATKMMGLADAIKPDGLKIVSLTGFFNQIDILDLNNQSKSLSVTTNDVLIPYSHFINSDQESALKSKHYSSYPICDDKIILALYNHNGAKQIHIITWDGEPIAKIEIDKDLSYIYVDFERKWLFGIEYESEILYKYDLNGIL